MGSFHSFFLANTNFMFKIFSRGCVIGLAIISTHACSWSNQLRYQWWCNLVCWYAPSKFDNPFTKFCCSFLQIIRAAFRGCLHCLVIRHSAFKRLIHSFPRRRSWVTAVIFSINYRQCSLTLYLSTCLAPSLFCQWIEVSIYNFLKNELCADFP